MKIYKKFFVLFLILISNTPVFCQNRCIASQNSFKQNVTNTPFEGKINAIVNQNLKTGFRSLCTQSVVPPVVLNGVNITSAFSGDVQNFPDLYASCIEGYITPANSIWLGQTSDFVYTFDFSQPVNNLVIVITGSGQANNEVFNFTTSSGNPTITDNGSCFTQIFGSTIFSGAGANENGGGGGIFTITNSTPFTSMTISGPGGENGSLFALCSNSVDPVLCNAGSVAPLLSANTLTNICPNTTVNLNNITASNIPTFTGVSLSWHTNSIPSASNQLTFSQTSSASTGATYYAAFFDSVSNCYSISTPVTTNLGSIITPIFTQIAPICEGSSISLPLNSNNEINGSWSPAINNMVTTTYTFTPTNELCANVVTMVIVVNNKIVPTFDIVLPQCYGSNFMLPTISNEGINGSWTPDLDNFNTKTYTFIPDSDQCAYSSSLLISVLKDFDFEITNNCVGGNYFLNSNPNNDSYSENSSTYNWQYNNISIGSNNYFNVTSYLKSIFTSFILPISLSLTVTNADGCSKSKEFIIDNLYCDIQKGISPNGDGFNEFFDLRLMNVKELIIYNRYGVKVYNKENYYNEWVGQTNNNNILPDGVYYYLIEFTNDSNLKTGWIYINR